MKKSIRSLLRSIKTVYKNDHYRFYLLAFRTALEIINSFVFGVLFLKLFLGALFVKQDSYEICVLITIQLIWQFFYRIIVDRKIYLSIEKSNAKILETVNCSLYDKAVSLKMETIENPAFQNNLRFNMQKAGEALLSDTDNGFVYIKSIILLFLNGGLLVTYEPVLLIPIVIGFVLSFVIEIKNNQYRMNKFDSLNPIYRKTEYVKRIFRTPNNGQDIKTTRIADVLIKHYKDANDNISRTIDKYDKKICIISVFSVVITVLFKYIPYAIICVKALMFHNFNSSELAVMITSAESMRGSLNRIFSLYPVIQLNGFFVSNYFDFMNTEEEYTETAEEKMPLLQANDILLNEVTFSYNGENRVLEDVTMEIEAGKKIAIVGKNGSGKTTLIKLLLRFYDPCSGKIYMDGEEIDRYNIKQYRERFGIAYQNTELYAVSLGENVLLSPIDIYDKQIRHRIKESIVKSNLSLSEGRNVIDTVITREFDKEGIELSGGQAQKLALARVIVKDSGVVVLDEPSAALDPLSEYELFQNMLRNTEGKTCILISHRLSACRNVDVIYVMDGGRVVEKGNHLELLKQEGVYSDMWKHQAAWYST
jgi:ATP-binding cassette subfamily B protein